MREPEDTRTKVTRLLMVLAVTHFDAVMWTVQEVCSTSHQNCQQLRSYKQKLYRPPASEVGSKKSKLHAVSASSV